MVECQRHCPSTLEVPNEGNGKEGVEEILVCQILWLAWMKEHHLEYKEVIDKGTQSMDIEKQGLVVTDKGKKPLERTRSDDVEKGWHQVKGKSEGKSILASLITVLFDT